MLDDTGHVIHLDGVAGQDRHAREQGLAGGRQQSGELFQPCLVGDIEHMPDAAALRGLAEVDAALRDAGCEIVALAGYMRLLSNDFVARWRDRIVNIHPSLLPKYKGLDTHARAIDAGDAVGGCSVHIVTEELDAGARREEIARMLAGEKVTDEARAAATKLMSAAS